MVDTRPKLVLKQHVNNKHAYDLVVSTGFRKGGEYVGFLLCGVREVEGGKVLWLKGRRLLFWLEKGLFVEGPLLCRAVAAVLSALDASGNFKGDDDSTKGK